MGGATVSKKTIFGQYAMFEAFMDHLKNKASLKCFQAFLSEFKTLVLEWKDLSIDDEALMPISSSWVGKTREVDEKKMDLDMVELLTFLSTRVRNKDVEQVIELLLNRIFIGQYFCLSCRIRK